MEPLRLNFQLLSRKKIWEIDDCYRCALIGTCLTRVELRKLSRERVFAVEPGCDDYQLHSRFIGISEQSDLQGKTLHKYLEKKYRAVTKKYFRVTTDREIEALWDEDLAEGRVDSAWWAIMTHLQASRELVCRLYGALHMLSHDSTNCYHQDRLRISSLSSKVAMLEEVLGSERQYFRQEKREFKEKIAGLQKAAAAQETVVRENQTLHTEILDLNARILDLTSRQQQEPEQQLIAELRQNNNALYGRIDQLTEELESVKTQFVRVVQQREEMAELRSRQERHEAEQAKEIAAFEGLLFRHVATENLCLTCADQNTGNCPGPDLCGKTVLYVGGLDKMVPHYRQLVENFGGRFLHHDGGKEASRNLLPKMLATADAVLCPIDCVSHDACNCVKKMCKRYQKPFVLMRSAGLSSLAKGLSDIVQ